MNENTSAAKVNCELSEFLSVVNLDTLIRIPDNDCLACEDVETGMGIVAMKYAFDKGKLNTARGLLQDGVSMEILTKRFNLSEEAILGK